MKKLCFVAFVLIATISTAFAAKVKRGGDADMTPYLNEADSREVCTDIVSQIVESRRIARFAETNGRDPIVTIGKIKDETGEFFDTQIIANSLKTAILKNGIMEFMANSDVRDALRSEVINQADHAREDAAKAMDEEDAADFMLTGSVKLAVQNDGKKQERTYIVNIELNDLQTHRTVDIFEPSENVKNRLKKIGSIKSR